MRTRRPRLQWIALLFALSWTGVAWAGLNLALNSTVQPGTGTYDVVFSGTLSNTSASASLFLNTIQFSFTGAATNDCGGDTNAFYANVPGVLLPGQTYSAAVFAVTIKRDAPTNTYNGSITILGGTNLFDTTTLATQSIQVAWLDSVGDGILDWWRQQYFGGTGITTNSASCAACDADGTGQKNLFKFIAGLDPTNPASLFTVGIAPVAGQTNQLSLVFMPAASGRAYNLQSTTNLVPSAYGSLASPGAPQTNGNQITIIDQSASAPQQFYRIGISVL